MKSQTKPRLTGYQAGQFKLKPYIKDNTFNSLINQALLAKFSNLQCYAMQMTMAVTFLEVSR